MLASLASFYSENVSTDMKTAIIGLPMTGKTSLFTILTGVHQETRSSACL
ncbi:hypothetical protein SBA4_4500010 [Candidatus Sulfopaludibacter sp. SbA4]|nr:hypothetical protein SBA4_4500010 [Candidatus Sulfopaludibacter sp. SbA4]